MHLAPIHEMRCSALFMSLFSLLSIDSSILTAACNSMLSEALMVSASFFSCNAFLCWATNSMNFQPTCFRRTVWPWLLSSSSHIFVCLYSSGNVSFLPPPDALILFCFAASLPCEPLMAPDASGLMCWPAESLYFCICIFHSDLFSQMDFNFLSFILYFLAAAAKACFSDPSSIFISAMCKQISCLNATGNSSFNGFWLLSLMLVLNPPAVPHLCPYTLTGLPPLFCMVSLWSTVSYTSSANDCTNASDGLMRLPFSLITPEAINALIVSFVVNAFFKGGSAGSSSGFLSSDPGLKKLLMVACLFLLDFVSVDDSSDSSDDAENSFRGCTGDGVENGDAACWADLLPLTLLTTLSSLSSSASFAVPASAASASAVAASVVAASAVAASVVAASAASAPAASASAVAASAVAASVVAASAVAASVVAASAVAASVVAASAVASFSTSSSSSNSCSSSASSSMVFLPPPLISLIFLFFALCWACQYT